MTSARCFKSGQDCPVSEPVYKIFEAFSDMWDDNKPRSTFLTLIFGMKTGLYLKAIGVFEITIYHK